MHHKLRELEARVLKLDRTIQNFSLAKTVLPVIHDPAWATSAELLRANETLDAMERRVAELAEMLRQLAIPASLPGLQHGTSQLPATKTTAAQKQALGISL